MKFSQFLPGNIRAQDRRVSSPTRRSKRVGTFLKMEPLDDRVVLTVSTWSGAVDNLWSNPGNWDTMPQPGDSLVFPASASSLSALNDLPAGESFDSLTLQGSNYSITGNSIALFGSIGSTQTNGGNLLGLDLAFTGASANVTVSQGSANLSLSGAISTVSGLNKFGPGQLVFANSLTYSGVTTVDSGTLVNNSNLNGSLFLSTSAILQGQGSSTSLTSIGGNIVPGTSGAGIISTSGALSLDSNSGFVILLNGTTPGTQYGEIEANGPIQLGNSNLIVTLGYTPSANETFTLINNTGNAAISGTFLGLNEGSLLNAGGQSFKISYVGGDGNNVVLTHQETTSTTLTSSPTTSVYGQPVNLTANVSVTGSGTGTPTGSVTFYNGTTPLGTAPLDANATAKFATSNLSIGASTLIAVYTGSDNFLTSMSSNLTQTVNKSSSITSLTSSLNPSVLGQSVSLSASVVALSPGAGTPSGNVTFLNGNISIGMSTLNSSGVASLSLTSLPVGNNTISVAYSGDSNFVTSSSTALNQVVSRAVANVNLTSTTTSPEASGIITITANVSGIVGSPAASGTVSFYSNDVLIGTGNLTNGQATFTTTGFYLGLGVDTLTATYNGDANYVSSDSGLLNVTAGTENERFINQAYVVLLNHQVDYQGLNHWNTFLQHGRTRNWVAREIRHSTEGQMSLIQDIFESYLGRSGTASQLAGTVNAASQTGTSPRAIVLGSSEYYYGVGGGTIPTYLTALETSLNTTFTATAKKIMTTELNSGTLHAIVAEQALMSQPGLDSLGQLLYQTTLGRDATSSEIGTFKKLQSQGVYWRFQQTHLMGGQEFLVYAGSQPGNVPA